MNDSQQLLNQAGVKLYSKVIQAHLYDAAIFDLDGVVTQTAKLHAIAWKRLFDQFLENASKDRHIPFVPFDIKADYKTYVDGKPRYDGIQSFLASRRIQLPWGNPDDPPNWTTIIGLGKIKNQYYLELLHQKGADVYASSVELIREFREKGLKTAVVSSSKNCQEILEVAHIEHLFDTRVDGEVGERLHLRGKPNPDYFLQAARNLQVLPARSIVFEDALSGVEAGAKGGFGLVIGVNRENQASALKAHGANIVVDDLSELQVED